MICIKRHFRYIVQVTLKQVVERIEKSILVGQNYELKILIIYQQTPTIFSHHVRLGIEPRTSETRYVRHYNNVPAGCGFESEQWAL